MDRRCRDRLSLGVRRATRPSRQPRAIGRRAAAVALLAAMLALGGACTTSALIVRARHGTVLSYQPAPGSLTLPGPPDSMFHNLDYNGGPVMASNTNYTFYWDPAGAPSYPADYQPALDTFFEDLAHDSGGTENADSVSTQYNDLTGAFAGYDSHFAGALIDTNPYPASGCTEAPICLTDTQIRAELTSYIQAARLPHDLAHEYFVLLPPEVGSCFEEMFGGMSCSPGTSAPGFCAYHAAIAVPGGGPIVYANDPYAAGTVCDDRNHPNGTSADATISAGLSHEHNESVTDPEPSGAWADWATGSSTGFENGDKCRNQYGAALGVAADGAPYNQVINGHAYWYQEEWSNQSHSCLQRLSFAGALPTASFTAVNDAGNHVQFNAAGSTAPGGVAAYEWQFDDGPGFSAPVETTAPTISHEFHSSRVWDVALTVFAPDGTSIGTAMDVAVGSKLPKPRVSLVAPRAGPAAGGTTVTITGKSLGETEAVSFGSTAATSFTVISATSVVAVSPPGTAEALNVRVTTPVATSAASTVDRFTRGPPTVTGVSPNAAPRAGGTQVTVTGSGFRVGASRTSFIFGRVPATAVSCASTTLCTMLSPAVKAAKTVDVRASVGAAKSVLGSADRFTFQ